MIRLIRAARVHLVYRNEVLRLANRRLRRELAELQRENQRLRSEIHANTDVTRILADAHRQGRRSNVAPFPGTGGDAA